MFYCFPNEIQLPGTQSFSIFGSGRVGYLKKSSGRVGYRDPVGPWFWGKLPAYLLPVSFVSPKFWTLKKNSVSLFASSRESHPVNQRFKQLCITEPVGGSAPKFSEKSSGFVLTEKSLHPFSLACPAQGSPTPAFRSALLWSLFRVTIPINKNFPFLTASC